MPTYFEKDVDPSKKNWYIFDANNQVVGRLATQIATILVGKHKANYTPHQDTGDFVVVVNADKVSFTGNKWSDKKYHDHSGFVGGLKTKTAHEMLIKHPEEILKRAVWGMLHKSKLARHQLTKLKIYTGAEHPHKAQDPKQWTAKSRSRKVKATK